MIKTDNSNIVGVSLGDTQFSKIYKGVDLYWRKENKNPNNEIWYRTEDNTIIDVSNLDWKQNILYNVYNSDLGFNKIIFDDEVTEIPNSLFSLSTNLIELVYLPKTINKIGTNFLYNCRSLNSINLNNLSNVTKIDNGFLYYCTSLQSIDLSGLSNVVEIGIYFLRNCSSLQNLDLSPLSKVMKIDSQFINGCSSLKFLDLSPLSNLVETGSNFLSTCSSLKTIVLIGFPNLISFGTYTFNGSPIETIIINEPYNENIKRSLGKIPPTTNEIFVKDEYLEEYKLAYPNTTFFKPLSDYKG